MSSGNHLVIYPLFRRTHMATHASFGTRKQIPGLVLPQLYRLLTCPTPCGVRPQPTHRWTMAVLATHPFFTLEGLRPQILRNVEGVAGAAFRSLTGGSSEPENLPHAQRNRIRKHSECARVLIARRPDAVLGLPDRCGGPGSHAAVTIAGGAATGTTILADLLSESGNHKHSCHKRNCKHSGQTSLE